MSLSVISTVQSAAGAATSPIVLPAFGSVAGDLIVIGVRVGGSATITGILDTALNTYIPLTAAVSGALRVQLWYAKNVSANAANVIQISASATTGLGNFVGCAWQISGADTVAPLDQQAVGTNAGASPITSATFTTGQANEIIVSATTGNVSSASTVWASNSGDVVDSAGYPAGGVLAVNFAAQQHRIVSAIQTNTVESMSFTGVTNTSCLIATASFMASAQPAGGGNSSWLTVDLNNGLRGLRH